MSDPIELLFGGLEKLGPGSNADTLHVLSLLPRQQFQVVVDAGCGSGRQTLVLARELGVTIHAVELFQPFLDGLDRRATAAGLGHLVQTHRMNMKDIPDAFRSIDLLWSEGAAYNIGFGNALTTWSSALAAGGLVVVSELSWLKEQAPDEAREFFRSGYPAMKPAEENVEIAEAAGYRVLATHTLPRRGWIDGYYEVLGPRAKELLGHAEPAVRELAAETMKEIEVFDRADESYGYVFFVLQRN